MEPIQMGDLIQSFSSLHDTQQSDKTIMSIAGISHLENVWSNIYAYYLDEHESHGLGTLFLNSLERIIFKKTGKSISLLGSTIKREYPTISGNRIDLLIQAISCSIIIENKVHHTLDNDLDDYWISVPGNNNTKIGIVLTLNNINVKHPNYINITHLDLLSEIEKELHLSKTLLNSKARLLLKDFITNVKIVSKAMDTTKTKFYLVNRDQINRLYSSVKEYRDWLESVFANKRGLGEFSLVHNDWLGCKHRFAMYRVLGNQNGELVITVFYEWLWNSSPGNARLCIYLQPLGNWLDKAIVNESTIRSIAEGNGVPSKDRHKDFWHCASVEIPVSENLLQNEDELKMYLNEHIVDPNSGLMRTAREVGRLLSGTLLPSYQWADVVKILQKSSTSSENIDAKLITQIDYKFYDPSTQIVVLEVSDNLIRNDIERYLSPDLLQAIRYVYGDEAKYSILCRQLLSL